jgi:E3 SUMO-protein ligase RanBP2
LSLSIFFTCLTAKEKKKLEDPPSDDDDVLIVYELTPTPEQKALATKLRLPPTFFCYKNRPDYVSEEEDGKSSVI